MDAMKHHERTTTKTCKGCGQEKPESAFYARYATCKECVCSTQKSRSVEYYRKNKEKVCTRTNARYHEKTDEYTQLKREWRKRNPGQDAAGKRRRRLENLEATKAIEAEQTRMRRHGIEKATPLWADSKEIRKVYLEAQKRTKESGVKHHVDHIVPLNGAQVCGLHCKTNLRVITASENLCKSKTFVEDIV